MKVRIPGSINLHAIDPDLAQKENEVRLATVIIPKIVTINDNNNNNEYF